MSVIYISKYLIVCTFPYLQDYNKVRDIKFLNKNIKSKCDIRYQCQLSLHVVLAHDKKTDCKISITLIYFMTDFFH